MQTNFNNFKDLSINGSGVDPLLTRHFHDEKVSQQQKKNLHNKHAHAYTVTFN